MSSAIRKVRAALGMNIYAEPVWKRLFGGKKQVKQQMPPNSSTHRGWRRSVLPAYKRKEHVEFMNKTQKSEQHNPLEPEWYESLPKWARAEGAYAPLEIAKIIFYLMIPVFSVLSLGSRSRGWVNSMAEYMGDYEIKAIKKTYEEQLRGWKKVDEEGVPSLYHANTPVPGSTLDRALRAEAEAREQKEAEARGEVTKKEEQRSGSAEYFRIMEEMRQRQQADNKLRGVIGDEALSIEAAGPLVKQPHQKEMVC